MAQATNATNKTQNFGLPLFVANDKPSWLVDWNGTMQQLDEVMTTVTETAQTAGQEVTNIESQVQSMQNLVDTLQASVEAAVRDLGQTNATVETMRGTIAQLDTKIDKLRTDVVNADNAILTTMHDVANWYFDKPNNVVGTPIVVGRLITDKDQGLGFNWWRNTIRKTFTTNGDGSFSQRFIVAQAKDMFHVNPAHTSIRIGRGTGTQPSDITLTETAYFDDNHRIATICEILPEANQSIIQITGVLADRPNAEVYALITFEYMSNQQEA